MKKTKKKNSIKRIRKITHNTVPASVGLVNETRKELKSEIRVLGHKMNETERKLDAKIDGLETRLDAKIDGVESRLDAKIDGVESRLDAKIDGVESRLDAKIEKVLVVVHRSQALIEEQRSENRIVLDGIKTLIDRQDKFEFELISLRKDFNAMKPLS